MYLKNMIVIFTGLASGAMVAAGTFAFVVTIGVFTRLAQRTRTSSYTHIYENVIILGASLANILFIYEINVPLYTIGVVLAGLFSGVFVGCLAMALAEILNIIPIMVRRIKLAEGLQYIVLAVAFGKCVGSLIQLTMLN